MGEKSVRSGREGWIDTAKILGLVIVLMNHAGLSLGPVNFFGGMFYVAVFFVLSGYTYTCRSELPLSLVVKKKAKRLLLPYAGYNAFLFLFFFVKDSLLAGKLSAASFRPLLGILYSRSYLYPGSTEGQEVLMTTLNGPTWFLTGLFVACIGFELLCRWAKEETGKLLIGMTGCFLTAWLLQLLPVLLPWSLDTMFFHIVLMGAGHLLRKKEAMKRLEQKPFRVVLCILVFIGSSILSGTGNLSLRFYGSFPPLYLAAALTGSVLAMLFARFLEHYVPKMSALLSLAGAHTMGLLCLHLFVFMFFTAGCGILGVPVSHPVLQVLMITGTLVVLTIFELVLDQRKGGPVWRKRK